jgi:1-acyl-sn-glycerol-3-phosphate acyltransferase
MQHPVTEKPALQKPARDTQQASRILLELLRDLALELRPQRVGEIRVELDSTLDKDLGFDSLGRMELLVRLEKAFGVTLSERRLATAETPRELLMAVVSAGTSEKVSDRFEVAAPTRGASAAAPQDAKTLQDVLAWHVQAHGERIHIYLYEEQGEPAEISYAALMEGAKAIAAGLIAAGLEPGQGVALMLPTSRDYFFSFFGVLLAGGVPVPIYPPARLSQIEDHLVRHAGIMANALASILITVPEALTVSRLLKSMAVGLRSIVTAESLRETGGEYAAYRAESSDVAFLQYTSGSTGNPKGVVLTHTNLLINIQVMGEKVQASSNDVFVSWLPLYHDMGLIGAWLGSLYYASPLAIMSPLTFLARPHRWLWAIHRHRGTLSAAPNFAYELCLSKIADEDIQGLDLSSWRLAFNGAEPVSPQTVRRFGERFRRYGFRPEAMAPVFGLAENAVGLTFPPLGRGPLIDRVQRDRLAASGQALPAAEADGSALEFVACGQPVRGHQVRVVDSAGRELPDRREGRLQFRGPSATSGYFRNPEASRRLFDGDWLDTGDLAYIADGDVYLTSRAKDIVIRAGRNIYPFEVEEAVGGIPGVRKGCVAVFGSQDPALGTERIIVLAETRETDEQAKAGLVERVNAVATDLLGAPPDEVLMAQPHTVLKTSSGKIRRAASRERYEQGDIGKPQRAVWWQIARLGAAGLVPQLRRFRQRLWDLGYAAYVWALFWGLAPPVWLLIASLPRLSWRWAVMRGGARLLARVARIPILVRGSEHLPRDRAYILVANHASYLDGILLVATLPMEFHFVAKAELRDSFVSSVFLRRVGSEFVERFDKERGVADARRLGQRAGRGEPLVFFPEGTFRRMPGLLPFRMGAFVVAAEAGATVVPIGIRGSRSLLRAGSWFPHRGALKVSIGTPIIPEGGDWSAAVKLRDLARQEILNLTGEPDLHEV